MATQNVVEQSIFFISPSNVINLNDIFSNSLIISLMNNSIGKTIKFTYGSYADNSSGSVVFNPGLELKCYVVPSFVATIQANITNLQAAFPQYTIGTFGSNSVFGN